MMVSNGVVTGFGSSPISSAMALPISISNPSRFPPSSKLNGLYKPLDAVVNLPSSSKFRSLPPPSVLDPSSELDESSPPQAANNIPAEKTTLKNDNFFFIFFSPFRFYLTKSPRRFGISQYIGLLK